MKILVLGANGRTGREVVREALARGHAVTGVVRTAGKDVGGAHAQLQVRVADPCQDSQLRSLVPGHDVVVSTLGPHLPNNGSLRIYTASRRALVEAMAGSDVRRLIVTSTGLLFPTRSWLVKLLQWLVSPLVSQAAVMEEHIRASGLDWTIVRTSFLTQGDEAAVVLEEKAVDADRLGAAVSRAGLAAFIVDEAGHPRHKQQVVAVYGKALEPAGVITNRLYAESCR